MSIALDIPLPVPKLLTSEEIAASLQLGSLQSRFVANRVELLGQPMLATSIATLTRRRSVAAVRQVSPPATTHSLVLAVCFGGCVLRRRSGLGTVLCVSDDSECSSWRCMSATPPLGQLIVVVMSIEVFDTDAAIVVQDLSGEVCGCVHRRVLEEYGRDFSVGATLVLKKVQPTPRLRAWLL